MAYVITSRTNKNATSSPATGSLAELSGVRDRYYPITSGNLFADTLAEAVP